MTEYCGHTLDHLHMVPGPPYAVHCRVCKDNIAEGVYQCLEKILSRAQDTHTELRDEVRSLNDKIDDLKWRLQMGRDLGI